MAIKTILAALLVPAIISAADLLPPGRNDSIRIIGGVLAAKDDFPYAVSLQDKDGDRFCTGSLLDSTTILTAAHCVYNAPASTIQIRAGSLSYLSGGAVVDVSSRLPHPKYSRRNPKYDVGILKLANPIITKNGFRFAVLASEDHDPDAGSMATAAGWGVAVPGYSYRASEDLREVDVPIVSRKKCAARYRDLPAPYRFPTVDESMICAGYIDDNNRVLNEKDTCKGDSGGPLVDTDTGRLIGVVSWGSTYCGEDGYLGVYARVGHLRSFIDKHMEASDDS